MTEQRKLFPYRIYNKIQSLNECESEIISSEILKLDTLYLTHGDFFVYYTCKKLQMINITIFFNFKGV